MKLKLQIAILILLTSNFSHAQLSQAIDFTIIDVNNDTTQLFNLLDSGQLVLMDCGAWWCAPCRISIPALKDYWNKYAKDGGCLSILSLDVANGETTPILNNQIINDTISYSVFANESNNNQLDNICWQYTSNSSIPQFILINPNKAISYTRIGSLIGNNSTYLDSIIEYNLKYTECFNSNKNEIISKEINIYPNPFNNKISFDIHIDTDSHIQFSIYDNTGKLINQHKKEQLTKGKYTEQISTQSFKAGLYFILININGQIQVKKVVKR